MEAGVGLGQRTYLGEDICQILEAKESIQFGFDGKEFENELHHFQLCNGKRPAKRPA